MVSKADIAAVRALNNARERREQRQFIMEGDKSVRELVQRFPQAIIEVFALSDWAERNSDIVTTSVKSHELKQMSQLTTPNQVLAVVRQPEPLDITRLPGRYLYLDGIQDPGNVGTIIRTAHWYGLDGIIANEQSADAFSPKVVQASMGSIMNVPIARIANFDDVAHQLPYLIAADSDGETDIKPNASFTLAIGQEGRGLSEQVRQAAQSIYAIKRYGDAESLNAAVACGILLERLR